MNSFFSFTSFAQDISFLRNGVQGFVQVLGPGIRAVHTSPEDQLASLAYFHGPRLSRNLSAVEGGRYATEVSLLRSWAGGERLSVPHFQSLLDRFSNALAYPHSDLEQELRRPSPLLPSRILQSLERIVEIDHRYRVFHVNGVPLDPLLDPPPIPEVFSFFEGVTDGGGRHQVPSLGISVYGARGLDLKHLSDLYRLLNAPEIGPYLFERVLYLVRRETIPLEIQEKIKVVREQGLILEVDPILGPGGPTRRSTQPLFSIPWNDPAELGDLDLAAVRPAVEARWLRGEGVPSVTIFNDLPILQDLLQRHREDLHWTDVAKLRAEVERAWVEGCETGMTEGQIEGMRKTVQGILGEIVHRKKIIDQYRKDHRRDSLIVLLLEGEIRTADGGATSDAVTGRLDVEERRFDLKRIYEVTTTESLLEESVGQHRANLEERFPEKGLVILNEGGDWGRVDVKGEGVVQETFASVERETDALRESSLEIVGEILAWTALRRCGSQMIPHEERRRYRRMKGVAAVGKLVSSVWESLWEEWERLRKGSDVYDVRWLELQFKARLPHLPGVGRSVLEARLACLRNLSRDLNPTGERISAITLADQTGMSTATISNYQGEIEKKLETLGSPVLPDPKAKNTKATTASRSTRGIFREIWEGVTEPREIEERLQQEIEKTSDEEVRRQLQAYLATLRGLSRDLNPTGERISANALVPQTGIAHPTIRHYQQKIEKKLAAIGRPILPDPEDKQAKAITAGQSAKKILEEIWEGATDPREVEKRLLQEREKTSDEGVRKKLQAYLASLRNLSRDLNPTGERISTRTISAQTGVSRPTILRYQRDIKERLRGLVFAPDRGF